MKISYDNVSAEYVYPLSNKDVRRIRGYVSSEILNLVSRIRFGCNSRTSQEGRTVKRGRFYDIRVNFCLKRVAGRLQSPMQSTRKKYIQEVNKYGGRTDLSVKTIGWKLRDAKRYAFYILLHEIGHVVYTEKDLPGGISTSCGRGSSREEQWCDKYSARMINEMRL